MNRCKLCNRTINNEDQQICSRCMNEAASITEQDETEIYLDRKQRQAAVSLEDTGEYIPAYKPVNTPFHVSQEPSDDEINAAYDRAYGFPTEDSRYTRLR